MNRFIARVRVVLTAAPTYLTAAAVAAPFIANEIAELVPDRAAAIVRIGGTAGGVLTAAVRIIRRVSPVAAADRGLLPADKPP